jgi:hypothetical protein
VREDLCFEPQVARPRDSRGAFDVAHDEHDPGGQLAVRTGGGERQEVAAAPREQDREARRGLQTASSPFGRRPRS